MAGFSLIEVLVAFSIAAILLMVLLRSFSGNIGTSAQIDASTQATLIAESTLETLGARLPLTESDADAVEGRYAVAASVHRYGSAAGSAGQYLVPYELAVSVSWEDGLRRRSIALRTVRLAAAQP
ncbi:MAG TPA: type II secretion system protein [Stellaceae bacterium]|jgi:general secretion pathway protein I|nr:type II secretion system protein [Stellaceae bacterium]